MKNKRRPNFMMYFSVIITFVAIMAVEVVIQYRTNKDNSIASNEIMVDQIKELITANENSVNSLVEVLKSECIITAKAVTYILENDNKLEYTAEDYLKIARLLRVDEIHVFDESGTLVDGSVKEYFGINFDDGEQIGFFKPMLEDRTLSMCQELTPNTAEGKSMMYAMVWREDKTAMIQIGITPEHLISEMKHSDISEIVSAIPVSEGRNIMIVNAETLELVASSRNRNIGMDITDYKAYDGEIINDKKYSTKSRYEGKNHYVTFMLYGKYFITVSQETDAANANLFHNLFYIGGVVILAIISLIVLLNFAHKQLVLKENVEKEKKNLEYLSYHDALTNSLNRHALFDKTDKFEIGSKRGVIFADLMGLKIINDNEGHKAGDVLIKSAYEAMVDLFDGESVFRIGGDEFVILSEYETKEEFECSVKKLSERLAGIGYGTALGCAWTDSYNGNYSELERIADSKMYENKMAFYRYHPELKR